MRRSGCIRLVYGMECPSDRMLDYIKKGITVDQAYKRLKEAHELGACSGLADRAIASQTRRDRRPTVP